MRPKKMGCAQTGVSILTGITKLQFSCIHRSVIRDTSEQSFSFCLFFSSFLHKHSNLKMNASIKMKFGTRAGQPKANISTNLGAI